LDKIKKKKRKFNDKRDTQVLPPATMQIIQTTSEEPPEQISTKIDPNESTPFVENQKPQKVCKYFLRGHCKFGNKCTFSHNKELLNRQKKKNPVIKKATLLEKLLEQDILTEQSVILQCLRYIVQKNFFVEE